MLATQLMSLVRGTGQVGNPLILTQTDTNASDGALAACSGAALATGTQAKKATNGGSAGSSAVGLVIDTASTKAGLMFQSSALEPNVTKWQAGTWVVRINVTTGSPNATTTLEEVHVCRINSSGTSQETIGSATGLGINVDSGNEGVKTVNVTGSATTATQTDEIYIVCVFTKAGALNGAPQITPDQNIDTPILI